VGGDLPCFAVENPSSMFGCLSWRGALVLQNFLGGFLDFPPFQVCVSPSQHPRPPSITHTQVADFNLSKVMEGSLASSVEGANNPRWMAPELLRGGQATFASDVFAFGVVMWEVLTWDIPWHTEPAFEVCGREWGGGPGDGPMWVRHCGWW
jgi:serine/threonine protein kinase